MMSSSRPNSPYAHAPAIGITRRLLGRFHVTGVFWYQFPYWACTRLPLWWERVGTVFVTAFFFITMARIRTAIASNLEPLLGPTSLWNRWRRAFRTMHAFAWCLSDRYRFLAVPERFRSTLEGEEHWRQIMEGSRGAVLVTAHIGLWETAAYFGAAAEKRRIHIVREKEIDPRSQEFLSKTLARAGEHYVTHFAGDDRALSLELAEALRRGEIVALQGDRPLTGGRTVSVNLFGRPMPLPVGPAALARAAEVPLLPVFNFREERFRFRAVVRPPIHVPRTGNREADVAEAVHRFATELEWAIRERPHQWFCFRKLWG